jgi:hypothetical protein
MSEAHEIDIRTATPIITRLNDDAWRVEWPIEIGHSELMAWPPTTRAGALFREAERKEYAAIRSALVMLPPGVWVAMHSKHGASPKLMLADDIGRDGQYQDGKHILWTPTCRYVMGGESGIWTDDQIIAFLTLRRHGLLGPDGPYGGVECPG